MSDTWLHPSAWHPDQMGDQGKVIDFIDNNLKNYKA